MTRVVFLNRKPVVQHWTGVEVRRLRQAKRLSVRAFAKFLGVSDRMVSKWEAGAEKLSPRPHNQRKLDQLLELCGPEETLRFVGLDGEPEKVRPRITSKPMPTALPRRDDFAQRYAHSEGYDRRDPFWREPRMLTILETRDIAGLYRLLQNRGVSQRRIAALTGQQQSEVSEILNGRVVHNYDLLVRICGGLGIPRHRMGLAYGTPIVSA